MGEHDHSGAAEHDWRPKRVGVLGAGVMGVGAALDLARHGYDVLLGDIQDERLTAARERIGRAARELRLLMNPPVVSSQLIQERITTTTDLVDFASCDLVIENIVEDVEEKAKLYRALAPVLPAETIICANTSCVSITRLGSFIAAPGRLIGAHLMNPVPMKRLVELIRGVHTSEQTIARAHGFFRSLGKRPVLVNDSPGFVSNRVLMLTINEAIWTAQDGLASAEDIDVIFTEGFGHKTGPLATGDLIGLDTILRSLIVLWESFRDPKFRPCPLLERMVDAGKLGRKSGEGFFKYPDEMGAGVVAQAS